MALGIKHVCALECFGCALYFAGNAIAENRPAVSDSGEYLRARALECGWLIHGRVMCPDCQIKARGLVIDEENSASELEGIVPGRCFIDKAGMERIVTEVILGKLGEPLFIEYFDHKRKIHRCQFGEFLRLVGHD